MASKTLINGTAYEIKGGKTLVDGTAYKIKGGKTLVGGTAYKIAPVEMVTVVLKAGEYSSLPGTPTYAPGYATATINGTVYDGEAAYELILPVGTIIQCFIKGESYAVVSYITVNGTQVAKPDILFGDGTANYEYEVISNCEIGFAFSYFNGKTGGSIIITEQ